jgi:hypothetical protein
VVSPAVDIGRPRLSVPPFEQSFFLSPMSALHHITDSGRTSREVRKVPTTDHSSNHFCPRIARSQSEEISGQPPENPTYCSTPAAANNRALSRLHLVRVHGLDRVGALRSAHLPVPILRRYAPAQREEQMSPRILSFGLKQPGSSPYGNRRRLALCEYRHPPIVPRRNCLRR